MLLHAMRNATPDDQKRAVQILAKRRPSADEELKLDDLLDRLFDRGDLSQAGRNEIAAHVQGQRNLETRASMTSSGSTG